MIPQAVAMVILEVRGEVSPGLIPACRSSMEETRLVIMHQCIHISAHGHRTFSSAGAAILTLVAIEGFKGLP
jgi:hypothetical protein